MSWYTSAPLMSHCCGRSTYEGGVREEKQLYDTLSQVAGEQGWLFVDNLTPLRGHRGSDRRYTDFDYHLLPVASEIIGRNQAAVVLAIFARTARFLSAWRAVGRILDSERDERRGNLRSAGRDAV